MVVPKPISKKNGQQPAKPTDRFLNYFFVGAARFDCDLQRYSASCSFADAATESTCDFHRVRKNFGRY
jgi:hypothetical protein